MGQKEINVVGDAWGFTPSFWAQHPKRDLNIEPRETEEYRGKARLRNWVEIHAICIVALRDLDCAHILRMCGGFYLHIPPSLKTKQEEDINSIDMLHYTFWSLLDSPSKHSYLIPNRSLYFIPTRLLPTASSIVSPSPSMFTLVPTTPASRFSAERSSVL